jgi:hypothetical protein
MSIRLRGGIAVKKIVFSLGFAVSLFGVSAFGETYNAYISDAKCGAKHAADMNAKCVQGCVKGGAAPVAVVGETVYKISDPGKVKELLGQKVVITGKAEGDMLTIENVKAAE